MPNRTVFSGKVEFVQILDKDGNADAKLLPKLSDEQFKQLYYWMLYGRLVDEKLLALQRSGRMGTFAQILGQEAQVGAALALQKDDWLVPSFRENALMLAMGAKPEDFFMAFGGFEEGQQFSGLNILPISIPVGTQPLHAVGIAWAFKKRREKKAVLVFFGDGGTSEGDFHEAMNFASVYQVPCVFVCQNNQWAISVPRKTQSHSETLAQKALGFGMQGLQIDGNDVLSVYWAVDYALKKAKSGGGPTLIEMLTYRVADHTTADDATRYRPKEEVEYWKKRDPLARLQKFLRAKGAWTQNWEEKMAAEIRARIEKSVQNYEALSQPPVTNMVDFVFAVPTAELQQQRAELLDWSKQEQQKN